MLEKILKQLEDYKIENISIKDNIVKLQISLKSNQNAAKEEEIIKKLLPNYQLQLTFLIKNEEKKPFKKIIGISSGKGGVGKSTISLHLAFALKEMGYKIGILDADIYAPSIPGLLNISEPPISLDGRLIEPIKTKHGFELLSMGLFLKENQSTLWRGPLLANAFNQFLEQGNWNCDYLIIDLPPGTSDIHMALAKTAPQTEIILVGTPSKIVYTDVNRMYITTKALNLKILGLIENMAYHICKQCSHKEYYKTKMEIKNLEKILSLPIFPHFHELNENGYEANYTMQEEKHFFEELTKKILEKK